jgi:hypothetical protein
LRRADATMTTYVTKPRRAECIQYDGANAGQIIAFVGKEKSYQVLGSLEVMGSGGTWKPMDIGDWVIKDLADGWIHATTKATFDRVWGIEDPSS